MKKTKRERVNLDGVVKGLSTKEEFKDFKLNEIRKMVEITFELIAAEIKNGNDVAISKFGVFGKIDRKKRMGFNPITGKKIEIPARSVPSFKATPQLKKEVNQ